jgi:hypothetical protein
MPPGDFEAYTLRQFPPVSTAAGKWAENDVLMQDVVVETQGYTEDTEDYLAEENSTGNTFVDALTRAANNTADPSPACDPAELELRNLALTANQGLTFASTKSDLVELFRHLDGDVDSSILTPLLEAAWNEDPLSTLKLIWNSRSIHLGKGEREIFYIALGWLSKNHPRTLLVNLQWLFRGVIEKDAKKRPDDDAVLLDQVGDNVDDQEIPDGTSHGYWKDLLHILVLSATGKLDMSNPRDVLSKKNIQEEPKVHLGDSNKKRKLYRDFTGQDRTEHMKQRSKEERLEDTREYNRLQKEASKKQKHEKEAELHANVLYKLSADRLHAALHYVIARLFAEQLSKDMLLVKTAEPNQPVRGISLCAKWAPSLEGFHDKHTLIATTIAEMLFPQSRIGEDGESRELYLKRARHHYRSFTLSPLRKALHIVERDISAKTFDRINYSHVPSLAMDRYKKLFEKRDFARFKEYVAAVGIGKRTISGAVLTPGGLVEQARRRNQSELELEVINGQWKTLVQRIKDSGSLSSGSMSGGPLETAIGLSLIISAVTKAPFGGKVITFSRNPKAVEVGGEDDQRPLHEQVSFLASSDWDMNTDFMKVFTHLILPLAVKNKVKPEDMVKRIFVFSDMHFDEAAGNSHSWDAQPQNSTDLWATHHQIIKKRFADAGYEVPELVYWNLSGQASRRPAPVTADMPGTALVSGRSQALIKAFLESGSLDQPEGNADQDDCAKVDDEDGFELVDGISMDDFIEIKRKHKEMMTALSAMKMMIGHKAYDMLKVED